MSMARMDAGICVDIGNWLRGLGLGQYEATFRKNDIDVDLLAKLTAQDLKDLGVAAVGHRRKLLSAIAALAGPAVAPSAESRPAPTAEAAVAERRQLTVMFCDLVGSTALTARLDPEDMRAVINVYDRRCAEAIARNGGIVAKYVGDGVLAYFGYPEAHERDAELAVEAGLAIAGTVPKLETPAGSPLHVRIGIATGTVVVGDLAGSGDSEEPGVIGATPNLASRLQGIAGPDSVVIADDTRRLLGSLYDLKDLGAVELKGIAVPTRVWAVIGPSSVESRFEALRGTKLTAFVGREAEIDRLLHCWGRAKGGVGQVVLLSGEAGVGKSRLAAEFLKRIADEPQVLFRYYCSPQHRDSAFYPVMRQMERLADLGRDDSQDARLDKLDAMLAQTATSPQDAALFADMLSLPNDGRYPALDMPPAQRRQGMMQALDRQIDALARDRPVLLVVEDGHWADPTTVETFGRLLDRLETVRALLLFIYRPEIEPPWLGRAHVTALAVNRLTSRTIGAMIDDVARGERLPADAREEIAKRADGIPLFAEEMTKAVLEAQGEGGRGKASAAIPAPAFAVPASLQASLMARLDRLGPAKEVAQIAAAIGRVSRHALLALVADGSRPDLDAALERLVGAGLLLRHGKPPDATYVFKHALLQELAYGALLREPRRALHARIVEALEAHFQKVGENEPEVLARHCAQAGLPEKAAALWGKAGRQSLKRSALLEAESNFSRALEQIAGHSSTLGLRREEITCQIGLASTLLLRRGYTSAEAKAALSRTLALIERADALGEPVEDPLALFTTLHGFWVASIVESSGDETRSLAAQCLAIAERAGAKGPLIAGHRAVGLTRLFSGDILASRVHFDRAIALYRPTEDKEATRYGGDHWSSALSGRAAAHWVLGYPEKAEADTAEALRSAREFGHTLTQGNNLIFAAWTHFGCGRYAVAKAQADEVVALAAEKGEPFYKAFGLMTQGMILAAAGGDVETAVQQITSALVVYRSTRVTLLTAHALSYLAKSQASLGQFENAWRSIGDATRTLNVTNERWCEADILRIAGEIALQSPDRDARKAEAFFERALAVARKQQAKSFELRAATSRARLWRDQGRLSDARDLVASVYVWFTEGFDTLDLRQAKAFLDELGS
jgi:class 3 adenylate cyclase/predicted ATPase